MRIDLDEVQAERDLLTLEDVDPGRHVRVLDVRYLTAQDACERAGIRPGARLQCVACRPGSIVVQTEGGSSHRLHRALASSISVEVLDGAGEPAAPA